MSQPAQGETTLHGFIEALASSAPTPGGGAASALAGALAAALAAMVGNLTVGRTRFQSVEPDVRDLLERLSDQRARLLRLIAEDAAAYADVAAAYAMPRSTDAERAARTEAVQRALRAAMAPPERIGICALETMHTTRTLAAIGNPTVASDAGCAALLAEAAVRCASLNVLANVVLLREDNKDGAGVAARTAAEARDAAAATLRAETLATVRAHMGT